MRPSSHSLFAPQKRRKTKNSNGDRLPTVIEKLKMAFAKCYKAVLTCKDKADRKLCELFQELPDKRVRVCVDRRLIVADVDFLGLSRLLSTHNTAHRNVTTEHSCQLRLL